MRKIVVGLLLLMVIMLVACLDKEKESESSEKKFQIEGVWNGAIEVPNTPLNIIIKFKNDNELSGSISIPVQNLMDFSLSEIQLDEEYVSFEMDLSGQEIAFDGSFKNEDRIEGTFTQQGQSFSFYLDRGQVAEQPDERDETNFLTVETKNGELKGELLIPEGEGPYPVALIIPGSGPTNRNGNSATMPGENNSLKMLAEELANLGIASVRYSKRGAGENQAAVIPNEEIRFEDFVNDAKAWLNKLKDNDSFSEVYVMGHSQGSLVGMLAIQEVGADRFVSLSGAGQPIDQVMLDQLEEQLNQELLEESKKIFEQLKQGNVVEDVSPKLQNLFSPSIQPFLMSWMKYNPKKVISELELPILVVQGEHDLQVSVKEASHLTAAQPNAKLLKVEEMNHVLKESPKDRVGNLQTYSNPNLPLAEGLVKGISEFLTE
ncbi:alpha/beta hydrolase [Filobacillus milosensis]|uniref:Alpha/beta hydrolase n=1 Tax=Filobacillus milosensis TaxID=94137 RepID=A0A4Y8INM8_9BACI|nr:alpha/beta hydrolase [Filobacillus milosensis]TFB22939.1 alpha/beta hydrolase [Filobacillus milosensis]